MSQWPFQEKARIGLFFLYVSHKNYTAQYSTFITDILKVDLCLTLVYISQCPNQLLVSTLTQFFLLARSAEQLVKSSSKHCWIFATAILYKAHAKSFVWKSQPTNFPLCCDITLNFHYLGMNWKKWWVCWRWSVCWFVFDNSGDRLCLAGT